jgi:hypothetical protein
MVQPTRLQRALNAKAEQGAKYTSTEKVEADNELNEAIREARGYTLPGRDN